MSTADAPTSSLLRMVAFGPLRLDRTALHWRVGAFGSVVAGIVLLVVTMRGWGSQVMPLAIGALFVPLAGAVEPVSRRLLSQLWTLLWISLATLLGGLVSNDGPLSIAVGCLLAPLVAFACGFAGAAGGNSRLVGVLALVCFAVFMGSPASPEGAMEDALLVGLGGVIQAAAMVLVRFVFRRPEAWGAPRITPGVVARMRARWSWRDDYVRHGVRLAMAFTTATVISQWLMWPHQYWIPMTVAWVSLPDTTGTATKVVARVGGTLIGLALLLTLYLMHTPAIFEIVLLAAIGCWLTLTFISANYTIAVAGVTVYIVTLFTYLRDPVLETMAYRALDTVIAGLITVAFAMVLPSVSHEHMRRLRIGRSAASS